MRELPLILLSLCLTACGQSDNSGSGELEGHPDSNASVRQYDERQDGEKAIRLRKHSVIDKTGIGTEAYSFLVPSDWTVDAEVFWTYDNPGMPANSYVRAWNPEGTLLFEVSPILPFFWTTSQFSLSLSPPGSRYGGHTVAQPMNALQGLQHIAMPTYRQGFQNLQVAEAKPMPGLVESLIKNQQSYPGMTYHADGAMLKLRYTRDGYPFEEEFYGIVEQSSASIPDVYEGQITSTFWYMSYMFSFAALEGNLDEHRELFETIIHSFRANMHWYGKYTQVVQMLLDQNMQAIYQAGQISQIISQTSKEINQIITDGYWNRQAVNDRIAENFSQSIRGTANYFDAGDVVELPDHYENVWSNGVGEYILSNDLFYNPNQKETGTWEIIPKQN